MNVEERVRILEGRVHLLEHPEIYDTPKVEVADRLQLLESEVQGRTQ